MANQPSVDEQIKELETRLKHVAEQIPAIQKEVLVTGERYAQAKDQAEVNDLKQKISQLSS